MFNNPGSDGLHPNAQGDLIIAGNLAKAQGYAGRSVGQVRKGTSDFSTNISAFTGTLPSNVKTENTTVSEGKLDFSASGESTFVANWASGDALKGFTVDLNVLIGNGGTDGWDTNNDFSMTLGNSSLYGTLNINEAYIQWGDSVLYSADMSQNKESLRVAYVTGNTTEGVSGGFYVWLGDVLIGEALSATEGTENSGVKLSYSGSGNVVLNGFAMDGSGSYAPTTNGFVNTGNVYLMTEVNVPTAKPEGTLEVPDSAISISGGKMVYANTGNNDASGKDVWGKVTSGGASSWFAAHGGGKGSQDDNNADFNGNIGLQITGESTGGSTVFGAVNAGSVKGNVYLEISAENATFGSFTTTNSVSVTGAYKATIEGTFQATIGAGTFSEAVMGGLHSADAGDYIGQTKIYANGGKFSKGVYGGGRTGTIGQTTAPVALFSARSAVEPASAVTITGGVVENGVFGGGTGGTINGDTSVSVKGGTITGGVYGGGAGDTINGNTSVTISGGVISGGIYGGGTAGTITGNTSVTIDGSNEPLLCASKIEGWSDISGGGKNGTIGGNATVTLKNIVAGNFSNSFDKYAGTISGGANVTGTSTLVLDNVLLSNGFKATLSDFDSVELVNGSATSLTSLGGASTLTMGDGTSLTLATDADLSALETVELGSNAYLAVDLSLLSNVVFEVTENQKFSLIAINGAADMDLSNLSFSVGGIIYSAMTTIPDAQAGTIFISYSIPEPSAFGLLAGLGALALVGTRRRRK